jgi:lipoprotein-anchoring transpeptidase ErfK/SrfK
MKRVGLVSLVCACGVAGVLAAFALAAGGPLGAGGLLLTTTSSTTTTTVTTTPLPQQPLPEGVTIGGIPVGGLTPPEAAAAIHDWFSTPLELRFSTFRFTADPDVLASPNIGKAIDRARTAQPFQNVQLVVVVRSTRVKQYVGTLAKRIDRDPVDARLVLRRAKPYLTRDKPGRLLDRAHAERAIENALEDNVRDPITLRAKKVAAQVTRHSYRTPVIVIHRGGNRLYLYRGVHYWRTFDVATGQRQYPTPLGRFQIVVMWKNPWWYPPDSPWAKDEKPVPPGPGNPLGTRWMGLSAPGVGIHGTPDPASIGYSVSHGCIRMRISEAEWLFNHVEVGSPVFIVAS